MKIAIIGGGIAGLSAAYRAEQLRRSGECDYTIFEQAGRLGGVIRTEVIDGCVVEAGPDSFLSEKPAAAALCREIGLGDQLIGSNDSLRKTQILVNGRLLPLPDGLQFMVPTRFIPTALTPLFSWRTKLRFAQEWFFGRAANSKEDESVAAFVSRHFGDEVVERLAAPLLSGIYGGEAARLSVRAVLPRMVEMEARYGSLTRALLALRKGKPSEQNGRAAPPALFTSLRGGMQQMVDRLTAQLDPKALKLQSQVRSLERRDGAWTLHSEVVGSERMERFDGVVLTVPAYIAGSLLRDVHPDLANELANIAYSSSIIVCLAYDLPSIGSVEMDGFGFLVPQSEGKHMLACTFVHRKFPHRAPSGRALLRCFIGGTNAESVFGQRDDEIVAMVQEELRAIMNLAVAPLFTRVYRWKRAMAQYEVGHLARLEKIESVRRGLPGLALAGNAYRGIGIPDCVAAGAAAVAEIIGTAPSQAVSQQSPAVRV
jgi:oxygen-dependent protoporphyrinogen oxidase